MNPIYGHLCHAKKITETNENAAKQNHFPFYIIP